MRKLLLLLIIPLGITLSQQSKLSGKVIEEFSGEPLAGVNIFITGTQYGTVTNSQGKFELIYPNIKSFILNASIIGYFHKSFSFDQDSIPSSDLIIQMEKKIISISDITITDSRPRVYGYNLLQFPIRKAKRMAGNLNDIVRSISSLPGFAKPYDYRNDMIVRGGSPSENLFLIDGLIVPSINHFGNQGFTGGPVSYIDPELLNDISVSSGGFNSIYGDKLSSVLELKLREGEASELKNIISVSGTQFSFNSEYSFTDNLNYIISLRRSFLDPLFRLYGFTYYPEYYDLLGKLNWKLNQLNTLSVLFIGTLDAVKFFDVPDDVRNQNPRAVGSDQSRYIAGISFRNIFNDGTLNFNLSRNALTYNTIPNYFFTNNSYEAENTIKGDLNYKLTDNINIDIGSVFSVVEFKIDAEFYNYKSSYNEIFDVHVKNSETFFKSGSYVNYSQKLNSLEVNAGLRLDYFSPIKSEKNISPRLSLKYNINEKASIGLKTGIYHQTPAYVWLAGDSNNKSLKNLRAEHLVLGFEYGVNDQLDIKLETYIKNYSRYPVSLKRPYLVLSNTGAEFSGSDNNFASYGIEPLVSGGIGKSKGIELSARHIHKNIPLTVDANISISDTYFYGLDGIKRASSFDQKWILNFLVSYNFTDIWSANLKFFFASGSPYTPFEKNGDQSPGQFNALRMPAVHSLDMRIEKRFYAESGSMFYLDIKNIYNKKNLYYYYYDTAKGTVSHDPVISILPTIGIKFEL